MGSILLSMPLVSCFWLLWLRLMTLFRFHFCHWGRSSIDKCWTNLQLSVNLHTGSRETLCCIFASPKVFDAWYFLILHALIIYHKHQICTQTSNQEISYKLVIKFIHDDYSRRPKTNYGIGTGHSSTKRVDSLAKLLKLCNICNFQKSEN